MVFSHIQHIEWLQEQLADSENRLAEARSIAAEAERSVTYIRKMLKLVNDIPGIKDDAGIKDNIDNNDAGIKRTAKQMLLPAYADKSIIDAIHQYLSQLKTEVATDDLIQDMW
jgi:hypothetical protein